MSTVSYEVFSRTVDDLMKDPTMRDKTREQVEEELRQCLKAWQNAEVLPPSETKAEEL